MNQDAIIESLSRKQEKMKSQKGCRESWLN